MQRDLTVLGFLAVVITATEINHTPSFIDIFNAPYTTEQYFQKLKFVSDSKWVTEDLSECIVEIDKFVLQCVKGPKLNYFNGQYAPITSYVTKIEHRTKKKKVGKVRKTKKGRKWHGLTIPFIPESNTTSVTRNNSTGKDYDECNAAEIRAGNNNLTKQDPESPKENHKTNTLFKQPDKNATKINAVNNNDDRNVTSNTFPYKTFSKNKNKDFKMPFIGQLFDDFLTEKKVINEPGYVKPNIKKMMTPTTRTMVLSENFLNGRSGNRPVTAKTSQKISSTVASRSRPTTKKWFDKKLESRKLDIRDEFNFITVSDAEADAEIISDAIDTIQHTAATIAFTKRSQPDNSTPKSVEENPEKQSDLEQYDLFNEREDWDLKRFFKEEMNIEKQKMLKRKKSCKMIKSRTTKKILPVSPKPNRMKCHLTEQQKRKEKHKKFRTKVLRTAP